jgi:hypothetical protein
MIVLMLQKPKVRKIIPNGASHEVPCFQYTSPAFS